MQLKLLRTKIRLLTAWPLRAAILLLLCLQCAGAKAQHPDDPISVGNLNKKYLEHLVKIGVDSVRKAHGLEPLINDSILYVAALDHGNYLNTYKKFSHYEEDIPIKRTPQLRAEFHGARNYSVGENIIKSYMNKKLKDKKGKTYVNRTYQQLANDFVTGWVNSPGHYANIITPDWQITGLAVVVNEEKGLVYGVQKFAKVQLKYRFEENKEMFSWSDYSPPPIPTSFDGISRERIAKKFDYGIKAPPGDSVSFCKSCNNGIDTSANMGRLVFKKNNIYFTSGDVDLMFQLIKHAKDGLALEFVVYDPFDCGNPQYYSKPSRRNNQSLLNGTITEPKYRKDLKKGFKKAKFKWYFKNRRKGEASHFYYKLGKVPKGVTGYYEVNLLVLQKNKLCRVVHFSSLCGETFTDSLDYDVPMPLDTFTYVNDTAYSAFSFTVPFERGKSDYKYEDVAPHLGRLKDAIFEVDSARIEAYTSVEGSESINLKLMNDRAEAILGVFESGHTFPKKIEAAMNWEMMEEQIANFEELSSLRGKDRSTIVQLLTTDTLLEKVEPYLAQQRRADVKLWAHYLIPEEQLADSLVAEFQTYFVKTEQGYQVQGTDYLYLLKMQYKIYELMQRGLADYDDLRANDYLYQWSPGLAEQMVWMDYQMGNFEGESGITKLYNALAIDPSMLLHPFDVQYFRFNVYFDQVLRGMVTDVPETLPADFAAMMASANEEERSKLAALQAPLAMAMMMRYRVDGPNRDDEQLRAYAEQVFLLTALEQLEADDYWKRAAYLANFDQGDLAHGILSLAIEKNKADDRHLALHSKLGYYHVEDNLGPDFYNDIIAKYDQMQPENWCALFVGECNISFQVFDHEGLRNFYCEKCGEYLNAAQIFYNEANGDQEASARANR